MEPLTILAGIATIIGGFSALSALSFYKKQARAASSDHLNNVHQLVFERLDRPEIRTARHYVYAMDTTVDAKGELKERDPLDMSNLTFQTEHWLALGSPQCPGTEQQQEPWKQNKLKAETMARALDQLGYLVREGIVPLNVVARFYTYPALKCWYQLSPYIAAVRKARRQPGHMWEWENLVNKIMEGARTNEGIWAGTIDHDNLREYTVKIETRTKQKDFPRDDNWHPPDYSWTSRPPDGVE